jgi:hypothetical protein
MHFLTSLLQTQLCCNIFTCFKETVRSNRWIFHFFPYVLVQLRNLQLLFPLSKCVKRSLSVVSTYKAYCSDLRSLWIYWYK